MNLLGSIRMPECVYYGEGTLEKLSLEVKRLGTNALIVSDKPMNDLGYVNRVEHILTQNSISSTTYLGVDSETKDTHVEEALTEFKNNQCDFIIALGGGSCIDAAKAVAVQANNDEELIAYVGGKKEIQHQPVPVVAIPTTAGTGSEVTDAMVITNTSLNIKMMIKQPLLMPQIAIVDPLLTLSAPKSLTVATGVDALTHAIEAFISRKAHAFTDDLALSAINHIVKNISRVYSNGDDVEARSKMALASMQAGVAFSNASVCLVHGMSRPIGALFHVPHGISNAMLLAPVLEYSLEDCQERLAQISRFIDKSLVDQSDEHAANSFITLIKQLCVDLQIPNLKEWGIDRKEFEQSLEKMATDALASGSPQNNPRTPSKDEIIHLYHVCYEYSL